MKYLLVPLYFLLTTTVCHAQKLAKNEFTLSYYPAGYFFDNKGMEVSRFSGNYIPMLSYTRNHSARFSSSIAYNNYFFGYPGNKRGSYFYKLTSRSLQRISLSGVYTIPGGWIWFRMKAGLNYCWGEWSELLTYPTRYGEAFTQFNSKNYSKWGAVASTSINHKIVWGLFGSIQADYVRMFKGIDPNQLYVSYSLGYRF